MPFSGGPDTSIPMPVDRADSSVPFKVTLAVAGTAEDFATIPAGKRGYNISITNLGPGDAWITPDATATSANGILIRAKETYSDEGLGVTTKWSFIGEAGKTPIVRGVVWCGV